MSRLIAIGDVHGEYNLLVNLLNSINPDFKKDKIIFLGDYIDRGKNSKEVVKLIRNLKDEHGESIVCLRGNHEQLAIDFKNSDDRDYYSSVWFMNGAFQTVKSYGSEVKVYRDLSDVLSRELVSDINWFDNLPIIHETENYIFVHAGLNPNKTLNNQVNKENLWDRDFYRLSHSFSKRVVVGHTPVDLINKLENGYIMVDTGSGKGGKLSAIDLTNDIVYTEKKEV